jgi:hypothetical protein
MPSTPPARCAGARAERPVADGEDSDSGLATINSRIVGVQRMIARGSPHAASHIIGRTDNAMIKNCLDESANQFA